MKSYYAGLIMALVSLMLAGSLPGCTSRPAAVIYYDKDSHALEELAAHEIRKYIYLRTGELLPFMQWERDLQVNGAAILVGSRSGEMIKNTAFEIPHLGPDDFILKTLEGRGGKKLLVCGGSPKGTLYAAYHLAEDMGVGFYLDGDAVPDLRVAFSLPELDVRQSPLFNRRGIQPFHDFPEGPDWWNREDYKSVLSQLPKLKMNFIGLHTYPEGEVGPEPLTWIGLSGDVNPDGTVKTAYPSRHFTTANGTWGYQSKKTSDYGFGAGQLYSRDDFGVEYMRDRTPWPAPGDEAQLFNDMGEFLNDVFSFANTLAIQTCLGTEIPLVLPAKFTTRLREMGLDPESPETRQRIYEGMFTRISRIHPLDRYWFWTPENWTWSGNEKEDLDKTLRDLNASVKALEAVDPGFNLATCGWVLGPENDRTFFDKYLPKEIAFSCISREVGWEPVDPAFARIDEREKWAIPWMEDDPAMMVPQLWVGRLRRDAADAYAYGCNGYFGIHWRTRVLSMNVSALAKAAWEQPWNPEGGKRISPGEIEDYLIRIEGEDRDTRDLECLDFYQDWCSIQFGEEVSDRMALIFSSLDGVKEKAERHNTKSTYLPRPSVWERGPGGIFINPLPWDSIEAQYAFIEDVAKLRPSVSGRGNLERFDYWLNQFRYLEAMGKLSCTLGEYGQEEDKISGMTVEEKKDFAEEVLMPLLEKEIEILYEVHKYLVGSVTTWGGIGNVTNWQQHVIPLYIGPQINQIKEFIRDSSWIHSLFPKDLPDITRIIVPSPQTLIEEGSDYTVKVICFNVKPEKVVIYWRPLGEKQYHQSDLVQTSDTYWEARIPSGMIRDDFEYHVLVEDRNEYMFPASAPQIDFAVTVLKIQENNE